VAKEGIREARVYHYFTDAGYLYVVDIMECGLDGCDPIS
jgi:hypothetical protein